MSMSDALLLAKYCFPRFEWSEFPAECIFSGTSFMICIRKAPSTASHQVLLSVPVWSFRTCSFGYSWSIVYFQAAQGLLALISSLALG